MKLSFMLSIDNYHEYNKVYSKISIGKNLEFIFKLGIFETVVGVCILLCRLLNVLKNNTSLLLGILLTVVGVYMILHAKVLFFSKLKREVTKKFKENDYFKNERTVEIYDEYLTTSSESDDYRANYNEDLKEIIETQNLFMIMVHGRRGIIIPKSAGDTKEIRQVLKCIAEEYNVRYRSIKR